MRLLSKYRPPKGVHLAQIRSIACECGHRAMRWSKNGSSWSRWGCEAGH